MGCTDRRSARAETSRRIGLIASPAVSGSELVLEQQRQLFERSGTTGAAQQAAVEQQKSILDAVITGKGWEKLTPDIRQRVDTPLYRSFLLFDPAQAMARVRQPMLIIQPALDREVPAASRPATGAAGSFAPTFEEHRFRRAGGAESSARARNDRRCRRIRDVARARGQPCGDSGAHLLVDQGDAGSAGQLDVDSRITRRDRARDVSNASGLGENHRSLARSRIHRRGGARVAASLSADGYQPIACG